MNTGFARVILQTISSDVHDFGLYDTNLGQRDVTQNKTLLQQTDF